MNSPILIVGAGGHAAVVADALLAAGARVLGFTDTNTARHGCTLCGLEVLGDDRVLDLHRLDSLKLANGIGGVRDITPRLTMQRRFEESGWRFVTVRHPTAVVSSFARIGDSAQLLAASVVQAGAEVGRGCVVNTAAVVEHDVTLGEWVHVAPRAVVCGSVKIGARSHIGAGAIVRQGVQLGEETVIGAGAVVVRDFRGRGVLIGVPARLVEHNS